MNFLLSLLSPVAEIVKTPLAEWQKRKTVEVELAAKDKDRLHEINLKKLDVATELAKQGLKVEANWDANAQRDMKTSLKDEYLTILFSIPLILAFIPSTQETVLKGFETLDKTPEWYMFLVMGIVAGVFGLRWLISRGR